MARQGAKSKSRRRDPEREESAADETARADDADVDTGPIELDADLAEALRGVELPAAAIDAVVRLQAERDEAVAARQRAQADFVNFQRRSRENEDRAARGGVNDVVRSLLPVLDYFDLALGQEGTEVTTEQLLAGVRMVREEFVKALGNHRLYEIRPEVGTEFDPNEHQAVMHEPTEEHAANTIVRVLQCGYAVDGTIVRPATVTVAAPPPGAAPVAEPDAGDEAEAAPDDDPGTFLDLDEPVDIDDIETYDVRGDDDRERKP